MSNEKTYYIGPRICDNIYAVYVVNNGYKTKEMVSEDNLDKFIQRLKFFWFSTK